MDLQTATGIDVRKGILESCVGIEPLILEYRGSFHMHVNVVELGYVFMEGIAWIVLALFRISEVDMEQKMFARVS